MTDDLVERVAAALSELNAWCTEEEAARVIIPLVLEHAAKVAEGFTVNAKGWDSFERDSVAQSIAAAIRAGGQP